MTNDVGTTQVTLPSDVEIRMKSATFAGCESMTAWLATTSVIGAPARWAICRWARGGIMWSAAATR